MPGEEVPPNFVAANAIAFTFNLTGRRDQFLDQFPVIGSNNKVQKFADKSDATNISFLYDDTKFGN